MLLRAFADPVSDIYSPTRRGRPRHAYISGMPVVHVTRTYLELRGPHELRPARAPDAHPRLERRDPITPAEYLSLYSLVGERWHWRDRLAWPERELEAYLARPEVEVWTATLDGAIVGYFELKRSPDRDCAEIMYFGLAPAYIGQGLGGWLLSRAVERAFALGPTRVVLNTCTLDGPHALPNYLARGFRIVRDEVYHVEVP